MVDIRATYYKCELADESTMSKITSDLCSIRAYDNVPKLFKPETPNILQAIRGYNQFTLSNSIFTPQVWLTSNYKLFKNNFGGRHNILVFFLLHSLLCKQSFEHRLIKQLGWVYN